MTGISMPDMLIGDLRLVNGLLVNPSWLSPLEGPYTVLAKLQMTNAMRPQDMCEIFGARLLCSHARTLHGRSLLDISWAHRSRSRAGELLADLSARTLCAYSERWWRALGSDQRLRFCPSCAALGFQSVLCQLEGLTHCPVHGDVIADCCLACGASTPRYAITREAFEVPMTCRSCGRPYADCWHEAQRFSGWSTPDGVQAYDAIGQWLRSLETIDCLWPDQSAWMLDPTEPKLEARKSTSMLGLLCRFREAPFERDHANDPEVHAFDLPTQQLDGLGAKFRQPERSRRQIYKSIRRHYRAALGASHRTVWEHRDDLIWDYPRSVVMPANRNVDAEIHAFLSWRTRFETEPLSGEIATRREARLELRFELINWPMSWHASDSAWGHFVQACLQCELSQAIHLHRQLDGLDVHRPVDLARWLELVGATCHRFGPARQAWPAALTCFVLNSSRASGHGRLVLVLPPCTKLGETAEH